MHMDDFELRKKEGSALQDTTWMGAPRPRPSTQRLSQRPGLAPPAQVR